MVDSQNTPARQRPSIVSISSYLLYLFLACQVISLIITLSTIGKTRDALRDAYAGSTVENADQVADVFLAVGVGGAIVLLLLAIVLGVLALFNNQGRNGARITTWIVGGIMVCCSGLGLLSSAGGGFTGGQASGDGPSGEEVQRRIEEALPSWVTPVSLLLGVISLIALITALILLALPKANEFFRKPTAAWEPPTPGASYPGQPQGPGQPGYPSSGEPSYPPPATNRPDDTPPADRPGSTPPSTS
ncbi:hypothetical protein ACWD69_10995 [Micromonospora chokoriensis]